MVRGGAEEGSGRDCPEERREGAEETARRSGGRERRNCPKDGRREGRRRSGIWLPLSCKRERESLREDY